MHETVGWPRFAAFVRQSHVVILWLALLWTAVNCVYVYLVLAGNRSYRIESSLGLLVALMLPLLIPSRRKDQPFVELSSTQVKLLVSFAVALWLLAFLPLLDFPFLSDDYVFLALYEQLGDVTTAPQFFRPLFAVVFWMLARLGGGFSVPFHAASLLLHVSSACLVYTLARRFFAASAPAVISFTVFLLNPLQLEASLWPSGLQELLWTFFTLAALACYVGAARLSLPRLLATMALVAGALLSKETATCFLLLLPAADWAFYRMKRGPVLTVSYATSAVCLVTYLLIRQRFTSLEPEFFVTPSRYFIKQFIATPYRFFAQPWNAAAFPLPPVIPCLLSLVILSLLFMRVVVRGASVRLLAGPAVILISTLPVYSYFFVGADLIAARYIYFAAVGWALLVSELLGIIRQRAPLAFAVMAVAGTAAVALQLNLRPWRTAGDVVNAIHAGLERGESPEQTVAQWQARSAVKLTLKNGIPYEYQGVGIFINGYPEFLRIAGRALQRNSVGDHKPSQLFAMESHRCRVHDLAHGGRLRSGSVYGNAVAISIERACCSPIRAARLALESVPCPLPVPHLVDLGPRMSPRTSHSHVTSRLAAASL